MTKFPAYFKLVGNTDGKYIRRSEVTSMQESRLFKIIYLLLENGHMTAPKLAKEFEVSVRTIYRDIDALSAAGIPIFCTPGKGGGISLMDGFVLNKSLLSENDRQTITSALQSSSALWPEADKTLLIKLNALFQQNNPDWIQIDFSRWGNQSVDNERFSLIKTAIFNRQLMTFEYYSSYGKISRRKVKPLRIYYKGYGWYLQTHCTERQDFRTFKINRMAQLKILGETFDDLLIPPSIDSLNEDTHYPMIKMQFKKEFAYRVYDDFANSVMEEQENGDIIVVTELPEDAWLYGYLLSFCGAVKVLEPEYVKKRFQTVVEEMYQYYVNDTKDES